MDSIRIKLSIVSPKDWGKLSRKQILDMGGSGILAYYKNSLQTALETIYPDITWQDEWFSKTQGYWEKISHQRALFDRIKKDLQISKASDWGTVCKSEVKKRGAITTLRIHKGSLWRALNEIYPGRKFQKSKIIVTK